MDDYFWRGATGVAFAVAFVGVLLAFLGVAAWVDTKTLRIPKRLTVSLFALGFVANPVRGLWRGAEGLPVWELNWPSAVPGLIDGGLFALAGAATAFVLFFALWTTGIFVGGGDVKLVTAAGAWIGPNGVLLAALASMAVFSVIAVGRIAYEISQGVMPSLAPRPGGIGARKARRRISYSFSFFVSVLLVLLYAFRHDLGMVAGPG